MAALPQIAKPTSDVECSVCGKYYRDPKLLECLHYFCRECVQSLVNQEGETQAQHFEFECPKCKRSTEIPERDASNLHTLFFVIRKTKLYQDAIQAHNHCDQCDEATETAEFYCRQCSEFVCRLCEQAHRRQKKKYRGHVLVTTEQVKQNPGGNLSVADLPGERFCKEHKKQQLRYYCCQCEAVMCTDCFVLKHQGHTCETIENCSPQCKDILNDQLVTLKDDQKKISTAIEEAEHTKSQIEAQVTSANEEVMEVFGEVIAVVQRHKEQLLSTLQQQARGKLDALDAQLKSLASGVSDIGHVVSFIQECLESGEDAEFMSLRQLMYTRLQEWIKRCEGDLSFTPATEADVTVDVSRCPEKVTHLLLKCAVVSLPKADPTKCTVEGAGLRLAVTNQPASVILHLRYPSGHACRDSQDVVAKLTSRIDGAAVQATIKMTSPELCEITYCPKIRGRHELSVCVNDSPIKGSPFQVFVEHPVELIHDTHEPVRRILGLNRPYGAVFAGDGILLVSESASSHASTDIQTTNSIAATAAGIAVVDTRTGKVESRHEQTRLNNPAGIGVDTEGFRYVIDNTNGEDESIKKYDKSWNLVGSVDIQNQFSRPGRITMGPGNEIFICDRANDAIKVFDTNLKFQRTLTVTFKRPVDIAFDEDGNMYVTQLFGNCISKLDRSGQQLLEFGTTETGSLKSPRGIVIYRNRVYVTERDHRKVSVFETSGKFVTDFGSHAGLSDPASIVVDEDGFFYVCDEESGCVLVF